MIACEWCPWIRAMIGRRNMDTIWKLDSDENGERKNKTWWSQSRSSFRYSMSAKYKFFRCVGSVYSQQPLRLLLKKVKSGRSLDLTKRRVFVGRALSSSSSSSPLHLNKIGSHFRLVHQKRIDLKGGRKLSLSGISKKREKERGRLTYYSTLHISLSQIFSSPTTHNLFRGFLIFWKKCVFWNFSEKL